MLLLTAGGRGFRALAAVPGAAEGVETLAAGAEVGGGAFRTVPPAEEVIVAAEG